MSSMYDEDGIEGPFVRAMARPPRETSKSARVHYAGALEVPVGKHGLRVIDAGGAACCWGSHARKIAEAGRNTHDRAAVTCKRCLAAIAGHDTRAKRLDEEARR